MSDVEMVRCDKCGTTSYKVENKYSIHKQKPNGWENITYKNDDIDLCKNCSLEYNKFLKEFLRK